MSIRASIKRRCRRAVAFCMACKGIRRPPCDRLSKAAYRKRVRDGILLSAVVSS
jgi:hypothetical protein